LIPDNKSTWEQMGELDPLWAILSDPSKKFGKWDVEEFLRTGVEEIARLMERCAALGLPRRKECALDFGCGVGRLTQPLAEHFQRAIGLDISEAMVRRARELNRHGDRCEYIIHGSSALPFADDSFDLIYTRIVLQHIPSALIPKYVREFVRTLRPGGLIVMQIPSHIPWMNRVQPKTLAYDLLRRFGVSDRMLFERLRLHPIRMNFVPEQEVVSVVASAGGKVVQVEMDKSAGSSGAQSRVYVVTK